MSWLRLLMLKEALASVNLERGPHEQVTLEDVLIEELKASERKRPKKKKRKAKP